MADNLEKLKDLALEEKQNENSLDHLLAVLTNPDSKLAELKTSLKRLSDFCKTHGKSRLVDPTQIYSCLEILSDFLSHTDPEIVAEVCWALSYLTEGTYASHNIRDVIQTVNLRALVSLLDHEALNVARAALRIIGNLVTGDDYQTQRIVDLNVMSLLLKFLDSPKQNIRKETCWILSNIAAGSQAQIQAVIEANIIPKVIILILNDHHDVYKEAVWVISNVASGGTKDQIKYLVELNVLQAIVEKLREKKEKLNQFLLEALENILSKGNDSSAGEINSNPYALKFKECGGVDLLNEMASSSSVNIKIKSKCDGILIIFFQEKKSPNYAI